MEQHELGRVNASSWSTIMVILSLDLAAPYITRMGLGMPSDFRGELRHLIDPELMIGNGPELPLEITQEFLSWLSRVHGSSSPRNLVVWSNQIFDNEGTEAKLFLWSMLAIRDRSRTETSILPPFMEALREELSKYPDEDVYRLTPTSDWDKRIYKHQEYDNLMSAMELVQSTIDRYTFRKAWSTVRDNFPNLYDVAAIKAWGIQTATLMKMPVARLGDPGSWPDLPALL